MSSDFKGKTVVVTGAGQGMQQKWNGIEETSDDQYYRRIQP